MATLPMEVMTEILRRLPAKSLLCFKSVCKLWHHLISSNHFIRLHLEQSHTTKSNLHFVVRNPVLHLADFDTFDNPIELDYPFKNPDPGGAYVVGSCHGLLCLWNYDFNLSLFVYNPTTRTHKILPFVPMIPPFGFGNAHFNFGFGYDSFSKDYKCVRILQRLCKETGSFKCEVMVYSLKGDSWHKAQDVPYYFHVQRGESAFFNGAIHWVGEEGYRKGFTPILCFILKDETFSSIGLPGVDLDETICDMLVGVLDGYLCLTICCTDYSYVWVMKEYGVDGSWVKLFSIRGWARNGCLEGLVSYSISKKELFVRYSLSRLASIDLDTMEGTDVKVSNFDQCGYVLVCEENLLMLNIPYDPQVSEQAQWTKKNSRGRRKMLEACRSMTI